MRVRVGDQIMSPPGVQAGPSDLEAFQSLVAEMNREQNIQYLQYTVGQVQIIGNRDTGDRRVFLPNIGISFRDNVINEFPMRFRAFADAILQRVAEERSRAVQPKVVKPVSKDHGRQYFITPKLLDGQKCENKCSICLEQLLPDDKKRKKVWKLGCGCQFHKICVTKWFKEDSRCPNCRHECSVE